MNGTAPSITTVATMSQSSRHHLFALLALSSSLLGCAELAGIEKAEELAEREGTPSTISDSPNLNEPNDSTSRTSSDRLSPTGLGGQASVQNDDAQPPNTDAPLSNEDLTLTCPWDMALVLLNAGAFCVDRQEVTNYDYEAFLEVLDERGVDEPALEALGCSENKTLTPPGSCSGAFRHWGASDLPVVCVDYCDAATFCHQRGKRLCGDVGDQGATESNDPTSEWENACAGPAKRTFSSAMDLAEECNGAETSSDRLRARTELSSCESSISGVWNLSGNAMEWTRECTDGECRVRGGSYRDDPSGLRCSASVPREKDFVSDELGFRCCADPEVGDSP